MNEINSNKRKLSDIRQKKAAPQWSSENVVIQEEKGDLFYKNEAGREASLQKDFEKEQKEMKKLKAKSGKSKRME